MGAWIEIPIIFINIDIIPSLPMWERGLKYQDMGQSELQQGVAPYVGAWIEIKGGKDRQKNRSVAPYVGAWIEIFDISISSYVFNVAPYVGAWIEIVILLLLALAEIVAPYVGAWIEIVILLLLALAEIVAPYVGAWIEIFAARTTIFLAKSLPMWERGLKYLRLN